MTPAASVTHPPLSRLAATRPDVTARSFVRRAGTRIVDGTGAPALERGVGIGTWLLPEGYMWGFRPAGRPGAGIPAQSPREIEALFTDLVGPERAAAFWTRWRASFFTEADVAEIAAQGFDHVRLPINSRIVMDDSGAFRSDGFALVDACIEWCRAHGLHVVLDLHGAPGGQTGTNIDDSPRGRPELFTDPRYRDLTVALWAELARRYSGEPVVAAYDLLNEPLPNSYAAAHAGDLVSLYRDLTATIRAIDPDHLIMYEGLHWASDVSIFTEVWDANSAIQFHRYWAPPDRAGIARYLEVRDRLGLPIYMGEGGENGTDWLAAAFGLYTAHGIGWNFWTWKKIDNPHSPAVVVPPTGWDAVSGYAAGTHERPEPDAAWATLLALVEAVRLPNCTWHGEVIAALLHRTPVTLPAYAFAGAGAGERSIVSSTAAESADAADEPWADDPVTIRYTGGEPHVNPFAADPAERARAGTFAAHLRAGDRVDYDLHVAEPAAGAGGSPETTVTLRTGRVTPSGITPTAAPPTGPAASGTLAVRLGGVTVPGAWFGTTWRGSTPTVPGPTTLRIGVEDGAVDLIEIAVR
ncbi:glycoside hydrolase family 5 protein [Occultella gossypii]|uniref:Cellulase family glycosylhydrolase n=1 Tax=Occultella gossypii TaxID=2800820 RepID=A0ABS7SDH2_9MICO|nr:cellulase family glycosylhydrolase [Occultella gossypii]MBZ2197321.1 cellulase family glycosylhydrolase [Occultella gossypii]